MRWRPTHRNPDVEGQLEVCDLCGLLVPNERLVDCDVEGLRGYAICDTHRFEAEARFRPSFNDYRRFGDPLPDAPDAGKRLEPYGAELWFLDPGEEE